jgi:ankyrin repeat protein
LEGAYDKALKRIDGQLKGYQDIANQVLAWVTYARRPLSVLELQYALAVFPTDTTLDKEGLPDESTLTNHCAGLVTIDEESRTVRLVHYTAQEYFERILPIRDPQAHSIIARTCLTYLSFDVFAQGECDNYDEMKTCLQENCLLGYAANYWGDHARRGSEDELKDFILRFFERKSNLACSVQAMQFLKSQFGRFRDRIGLHVAASFGLKLIVRLLVEKGGDLNARDSWGRTALHVAAEEGFMDLIECLPECEASKIDSESGGFYSPLELAMMHGHEGVVRVLLERGDANTHTVFKEQIVLTWAAEKGFIELVRLMLASNDANADLKDESDRTALSYAAEMGRRDVVQLLLDRDDVNADSPDHFGRTPLSFAAEGGYQEIARLLLMREDVKADSADPEGSYGGDRTPLSWAAGEGHEDLVRLLLARDDINADSFDNAGSTPLLYAAIGGHEGVVQELIQGGAEIDAAATAPHDGETALAQCAAGGFGEAVTMLMKHGANIEARTRFGETALDTAVNLGHVSVVQLLLENGAQLNVGDDGETALHQIVSNLQDEWRREQRDGGSKLNVTWNYEICGQIPEPTRRVNMLLEDGRTEWSWLPRGGHKEMIELLLKNGVEIDAKDIYGRTALHVAVIEGHEVVARLLLMKGANVNAVDESGQTALHWAACNGAQAMLEILLENGADAKSVCDGESALHVAVIEGHEVVARLLLMKGANVNAVDEFGQTALYWAASNGDQTVLEILLENGADTTMICEGGSALHIAASNGHEAISRLLLASGAEIDDVDEHQMTALHVAVIKGHEVVVRLLLMKGANVNAVDEFGQTALHWAASNSDQTMLEILLENGANIAIICEEGSALHIAASNGHEAILRLLLASGAEIDAIDEYQMTALFLAVTGGHLEVAKLLIDKGARAKVVDVDGMSPLSWAMENSDEPMIQLLKTKT